MKQFFLVMCVMMLGAAAQAQVKSTTPKTGGVKPVKTTAGTAATPAVLRTAIDSFSYAVGVNIANNLKTQNITKINQAAMQKAISDVFAKKGTILTDEQCNVVIQTMLQGSASRKADVEKAKSKKFLEENKKRAGVITLPSGLQYEVLRAGDPTSAMLTMQDTFVVHYAGTLIDGKEFDNSYKRGEPLVYPVGAVIRGWTEALQLMHKGDKWKLYIPSELGYGDRGAGADIPGGAALIFEMELLDIKPGAPAAEEKK
ncbi:MAG: hypothetical protein RL172_2780 [Bacteroidota bacterium]|jgi:FKBP-type peptidyl-prolyl cis-trans isomerase